MLMPETQLQQDGKNAAEQAAQGGVMSSVGANFEASDLSPVRINWQIKAVLPIVFVLLNGMLLFTVATVSWQNPERHAILVVAGAGAIAICGALLLVLAYLIQRPMVE